MNPFAPRRRCRIGAGRSAPVGLRWRLAVSLLAAWTLLHAPGDAATLRVNNALGDDRLAASPGAGSGGVDRRMPFRTIGAAVAAARPGDRVQIAKTEAPYREQVSISRCGGRRPIVIEGDGAVLDGTVAAAPGAWESRGENIFALRVHRLATQRLLLGGVPAPYVPLPGAGAAADRLAPRQWSLAGGRLLLRVDPGRTPASYSPRHAGLQTGITLYNARNVVIRGLVVQGFQQDGVNAHDGATGVTLQGLELRANGRSGLSVGGACKVRAEGCNLYDNGRVQARAEAAGRLVLQDCELEGDGQAPEQQAGRFATIQRQP